MFGFNTETFFSNYLTRLLSQIRYCRALELWAKVRENSVVRIRYEDEAEFLNWVGDNSLDFTWPYKSALQKLDTSGAKLIRARCLLRKAETGLEAGNIGDSRLLKDIQVLNRRTRMDLRGILDKRYYIENSSGAVEENFDWCDTKKYRTKNKWTWHE